MRRSLCTWWVVEVVYDLLKVLLGLVLTGHIGKADALGGLDVDLGIGLAHAEHHGVAVSAHFLHHIAGNELADADKEDQRQHPAQNAHQQGGLLHLLAGGGDARVQQTLHQPVIGNDGRFIDGLIVLTGEQDAVALLLYLHLPDLFLLRHGDEGVVVHLTDLVLRQPGHSQQVEQQQHQHRNNVIVEQRLLGGLDLSHTSASLQTYYSKYYSRAVP